MKKKEPERKPTSFDYLLLSQFENVSQIKSMDEIIKGISNSSIIKKLFSPNCNPMKISEYLHSYIAQGFIQKDLTGEVRYGEPVRGFKITSKGLNAYETRVKPLFEKDQQMNFQPHYST